MNCVDVRPRLPEWVYGHLSREETAVLSQHVKECADCRREALSLERLRQLLDTPAPPAVHVDVARVYQAASERHARRLRRWRRAACAIGAVAALLVVAVFVRAEVRLGAHDITVRWGGTREAEVSSSSQPESVRVQPAPAVPAQLDERVEVLTRLLHALVNDADMREDDRRREIAVLQQRLELLQAQGNVRWSETKRDLDALYLAQFSQTQKGNQP
jgi:predicted anti-sigma-YlaC factor YlaD